LRRAWLIAVALALVAVVAAAQRGASSVLILISFDGFRRDYIDRGESPNLKALADRGVRARGLIPSFPSVTFPNHYTIVTGLFPEHHGIVANTMEDPAWPERFTMSSMTARDPRWWGGEPIWTTVRRKNLRAASVFWPGSEARTEGAPPDDWIVFDDDMPNVDRVNHVLDTLARPEGERPSFVTVYFSEADHAGHDYGPDSPEVSEAIRHLDASLGLLETGLRELRLFDRTTIVVVSDHGMAPLSDGRVVFIDDYIDLARVDVVDWGEAVQIRPRTGSADDVYRTLKGKHPAMTVYKREEIPARLHYRDNARIQPVVALADEGWEITTRQRWANDAARYRQRGGAHGYDPQLPSMQGVFVAAGPRVRRGLVVPPFQNVHVYDFLCAVLGVTPARNDGDAAVTRPFLTP
jgi:predicted AlkP superfamily pyrophosphatase or phosphodiesterase